VQEQPLVLCDLLITNLQVTSSPACS